MCCSSKYYKYACNFIDCINVENWLFQSTEEDHADKTEVLKAINAMTDVAQAINEYKRRKDLGRRGLK